MGNDLLGLNVLLSTGAKPGYVPDFSPLGNQVVCGPHWETLWIGDRLVSIKTPETYDIGTVAAQLPDGQRPDLLVVKTDAVFFNTPHHLAALRCPKVLLFGDTHHGGQPIGQLLSYVDAESFDQVVLLYDRHHAHWLTETGHADVLFMPGLDVQHLDLPFHEERRAQIVFVGQTGRLHPRRTNLLEELAARRYPLRAQLAGREDSSRLYGESLITFNCSLNGDLNMRVFEALEAGAFLLTDRLSPQSGLGELFEDGRHLVCYDSPRDLADKAGYYLAHPAEALAIARAGYERCREQLHPAALASDLLAIVHGDAERARRYRPVGDARTTLPVDGRVRLDSRVALYELVQEVHRRREVVKLLAIGAAEQVCDLVDLPRLRAFLVEEATTEADLARIHAAGVGEQLWLVALNDAATGDWDTVVVGADRIEEWLERVLAVLRFRRLVIADWNPARAPAITARLSGLGCVATDPRIGLFERVAATMPGARPARSDSG